MTERIMMGIRPWIIPLITVVGVGISTYLGVMTALAEIRADVRINSARIGQIEQVNNRQDRLIEHLQEARR